MPGECALFDKFGKIVPQYSPSHCTSCVDTTISIHCGQDPFKHASHQLTGLKGRNLGLSRNSRAQNGLSKGAEEAEVAALRESERLSIHDREEKRIDEPFEDLIIPLYKNVLSSNVMASIVTEMPG